MKNHRSVGWSSEKETRRSKKYASTVRSAAKNSNNEIAHSKRRSSTRERMKSKNIKHTNTVHIENISMQMLYMYEVSDEDHFAATHYFSLAQSLSLSSFKRCWHSIKIKRVFIL